MFDFSNNKYFKIVGITTSEYSFNQTVIAILFLKSRFKKGLNFFGNQSRTSLLEYVSNPSDNLANGTRITG